MAGRQADRSRGRLRARWRHRRDGPKLLPFVERSLGGKAKFVVMNKPGAGGEIAFMSIARAAPDAYVIGVVNVFGYNFLQMTRKTQYTTDDIRLVACVVEDPNVVVVPADSRLNNLGDVIAALGGHKFARSRRCARRRSPSKAKQSGSRSALRMWVETI